MSTTSDTITAAGFTGDVTGDLTGDVTGNVTGDVTGAVQMTCNAYNTSGAISIASQVALLTEAGASAMTLAAPTATTHDGIIIHIIATTANAHTVTATTIGFNAGDAGADVGTFGGAIGDMISVVAYQGEWYVLNNINVTLA